MKTKRRKRASDLMPGFLRMMRCRPARVRFGPGGWTAYLEFEVHVHDKSGVLETVEEVVSSTRRALEASGDGFRLFAHTRGFRKPEYVGEPGIKVPCVVVDMHLKPVEK